jgi:WD40 repeat protein
MLDANAVSSASIDSAIYLWDIRNSSSTPVFQVIPDTKPVVQVAASPKQEVLAVTTRKGLYCLELSSPGGANSVLSPLIPLPPAGPCTDMKWNAKTRQIYCSGVDGAINVFGKVNY